MNIVPVPHGNSAVDDDHKIIKKYNLSSPNLSLTPLSWRSLYLPSCLTQSMQKIFHNFYRPGMASWECIRFKIED